MLVLFACFVACVAYFDFTYLFPCVAYFTYIPKP
jgi:hypothetical protein